MKSIFRIFGPSEDHSTENTQPSTAPCHFIWLGLSTEKWTEKIELTVLHKKYFDQRQQSTLLLGLFGPKRLSKNMFPLRKILLLFRPLKLLTRIVTHAVQPLFLKNHRFEQNGKPVPIFNFGIFGPPGTRSKKNIGFSSFTKAFKRRMLLIGTLI